METAFLNVLPNLSVGALAVVTMAYMMIKNNESREKNTQRFLETLDNMRSQHEAAMKERESAFRELEREVRNKILSQLTDNSKIMERVIGHLDRRLS
jgi:hypothetical protein